MKIYLQKQDRKIERDFSGTAEKLLKELNINPITVVVTKNNQLISMKEQLDNKDNIKILSVISGG